MAFVNCHGAGGSIAVRATREVTLVVILALVGFRWLLYCNTVHNSNDLEPTQMSIHDRLDKENVAHIHHGILCSHKKDEFVSFAGTWMKLETIILSKLTQEQKMKYRIFSLIGR